MQKNPAAGSDQIRAGSAVCGLALCLNTTGRTRNRDQLCPGIPFSSGNENVTTADSVSSSDASASSVMVPN